MYFQTEIGNELLTLSSNKYIGRFLDIISNEALTKTIWNNFEEKNIRTAKEAVEGSRRLTEKLARSEYDEKLKQVIIQYYLFHNIIGLTNKSSRLIQMTLKNSVSTQI